MDCVILRALMKKLNRKEVSNEVEEAFPATEKVKVSLDHIVKHDLFR